MGIAYPYTNVKILYFYGKISHKNFHSSRKIMLQSAAWSTLKFHDLVAALNVYPPPSSTLGAFLFSSFRMSFKI